MKKKREKKIEMEGGERSIYRQLLMACARLQICKAPLHPGVRFQNFWPGNGGKVGWEILPCKTAKISHETQPLLPDNIQIGSLFMWEMASAAVFIRYYVCLSKWFRR